MPEEATTSQMVIVTLVAHEPALERSCPNCHRKFKAREQVFVSVGEEVLIHVTCVVGLALVAAVHDVVPATTEGVYNHLREHVLDTAATAPVVD
jgi:hypothetical protein